MINLDLPAPKTFNRKAIETCLLEGIALSPDEAEVYSSYVARVIEPDLDFHTPFKNEMSFLAVYKEIGDPESKLAGLGVDQLEDFLFSRAVNRFIEQSWGEYA